MSDYTIASFIERTRNKDRNEGLFELETPRMLEVNLEDSIWMKMGAMVGYHGDVKFTRESMLSQGVGNLLKKAVSGQGASLSKVEGRGVVYVADMGKKVTILELQNESLIVNANDVLAFQNTIQYDIKMMKKIAAMVQGGLFNIRLQGTGLVAITTHYDPVTLVVTPGCPIITDPNATVAWSGNLEPKFRKDVSLKTFIGRGSGDSIQMEFDGEGFVVIQPYEEIYAATTE